MKTIYLLLKRELYMGSASLCLFFTRVCLAISRHALSAANTASDAADAYIDMSEEVDV